jgi:hypothetical protein
MWIRVNADGKLLQPFDIGRRQAVILRAGDDEVVIPVVRHTVIIDCDGPGKVTVRLIRTFGLQTADQDQPATIPRPLDAIEP